jgi:hypothetical protein
MSHALNKFDHAFSLDSMVLKLLFSIPFMFNSTNSPKFKHMQQKRDILSNDFSSDKHFFTFPKLFFTMILQSNLRFKAKC